MGKAEDVIVDDFDRRSMSVAVAKLDDDTLGALALGGADDARDELRRRVAAQRGRSRRGR